MDGAKSIEIEEAATEVSLTWWSGSGAMKKARYPWIELDRLQRAYILGPSRREARGDETSDEIRAWSELLRTLGQDLDEQKADSASITGDLSGLTAIWRSPNGFGSRQYTATELWAESHRRATLRSATA